MCKAYLTTLLLSIFFAFLSKFALCVDITSLSLEELMEIEVNTATKAPQKLKDTPSAVFVITQEDIRRSGATTIAEILKMVPGLHSARVNSSDFALSVRGFTGLYSNKLLVLIDGRTVYNPIFSGVFWDCVDIVLEDIDRIEVIRGPGASLWGANAVNGIINIITKDSKDTKGLLVNVGVGTEDREILEMRYGGDLNNNGSYRIFMKARERDPSFNPSKKVSSSEIDDWRMVLGGFKTDTHVTDIDKFTIEGTIFQKKEDELETTQSVMKNNLCHICHITTKKHVGANILSKWQRKRSKDDVITFQGYYDYQEATGSTILDWSTHIFDLEYEQNKKLDNFHLFTWGGGVRFYKTETTGNDNYYFTPKNSEWIVLNGFMQDKIELLADKLFLYLGTKIEYHEDVGIYIQPNSKILWNIDNKNTIWASVARAMRVPSRGELNAKIKSVYIGPVGVNQPFQYIENYAKGNKDLDPEDMWAFEAGYRTLLFNKVTLDSTIFFNKYYKLISLPHPDPAKANYYFYPVPHIVSMTDVENSMDGESYGFETEVNIDINDWWKIKGAYSYLKVLLYNQNERSLIV